MHILLFPFVCVCVCAFTPSNKNILQAGAGGAMNRSPPARSPLKHEEIRRVFCRSADETFKLNPYDIFFTATYSTVLIILPFCLSRGLTDACESGVGTTSAREERRRRLMLAMAPTLLNSWSPLTQAPQKKQHPSTNSMFEKTDPSSDAFWNFWAEEDADGLRSKLVPIIKARRG